jgi:phosphatidylglycerol:prolipoprotein diacylglycerol transferase
VTFPVVFHVFGQPVPSHEVCETAGYVVAVLTYLINRRRESTAAHPAEASFSVMVWCVLGAMVGAKLLAWIEMSPDELAQITDWRSFLGGKTIVGGLLGGWVAVEIAKRIYGINRRTGDAYVAPLVFGIAIGRVGCFLTGLPDHTYGIATKLPWGVDFGDGIRRHPTQLYEIAFALSWGAVVWLRAQWPYARGDLFRLFMLGYFTFRLLVEFIKPVYRPEGLSAIQCACVIGIGISVYGFFFRPQVPAGEVCDART